MKLRKKRATAFILCMSMIVQLFTFTPITSVSADDRSAQAINILEALKVKNSPNLEAFEKISMNVYDPVKQDDGSYLSGFQMDARLSNAVLSNINSDESEAFRQVYENVDADVAQDYIENALAQYDKDQTPDSNGWIDFTQLKDIDFEIQLNKEFSPIFTGEFKLNQKLILKQTIEGKEYEIGWYKVTKDDSDQNYLLIVSMNKIVYALQDVTCGCSMSLKMRASSETGKIPNITFQKDDLELVITDVADKTTETPVVKDPAYTIEKTAAEQTAANYIDYTIKVTGVNGANLNQTVIKDMIPDNMEVTDARFVVSGKDPVSADYEVKADTLYITLPSNLVAANDAANTMKAEYMVRMQLTSEAYYNALNSGSYSQTVTNTASLLNVKKDKTLTTKDAQVSTKMAFDTLSKDGQQDPYNGSQMNWSVGFQLNGTRCDNAYIIDTLDMSKHMYAKSGDDYQNITITAPDYAGHENVSMQVKTFELPDGNSSDYSFSAVTVDLIKEIATEEQCAYIYSYMNGTDKKAVLVIPVADYLNQGNVNVTYSTDIIYSEDDQVDDYLETGKNKLEFHNEVRMIWKNYYYGTHGTMIDRVDFTINKNLAVNYAYGQKTASGTYNEAERKQNWKFIVNQYGGHMPDTIVEDTLDNSVQAYSDELISGAAQIEATYKNRQDQTKSGVVSIPSRQASKDANGGIEKAPYYEITEDADQTKLSMCFGDLTTDDYYEYIIKTYIKDIQIIGGNVSDRTLENHAVISIANGVDGRKENTLDAQVKAANTIITKEAVNFTDGKEYEYDYQKRALKWKVTVNENHSPIQNMVITDQLPEGTELGEVVKVLRYKKGETDPMIADITNDGTQTISFSDGTTFTTDTGEAGKVKWISSLNHDETAINSDYYVFEFTTVFTTDYQQANWKNNEKHTVMNQVSLSGKIYDHEITGDANANAVHQINAAMVDKSGKFNQEDKSVEWTLILNRNELDLAGTTISDDLSGTKMEFVENTSEVQGVRVEQLQVDKDGSISVNTDAAVVAQMNQMANAISQSMKNSDDLKFTYTVPIDAVYHNNAIRITVKTFASENVPVNSLTNKLQLRFANGDSAETGEMKAQGSNQFNLDDYVSACKSPVIQVKKESNNRNNADKNQIFLGGGEFEISELVFDADTGSWVADPVKSRTTKASNGSAIFMNLERGVVYKVVETKAPAGYTLDDTPKYVLFENDVLNESGVDWTAIGSDLAENRVIVHSGKSSIVLNITDQPLDSSKVSFITTGPAGEVLEGTEYSLTDNAGRVKKLTATSNEAGVVTFEHLDTGTYTLKEISAPSYYMAVQSPMTVKLSWNTAADGGAGAYEYTITGSGQISGTQDDYKIMNQIAKGSITIQTKDSVTDEALKEISFTLSNHNDPEDTKEKITDTNGKVAFDQISADTTYTLKETKLIGYDLVTETYTIQSLKVNETTVKIVITPKDQGELLVNSGSEYKITHTPISAQDTIVLKKTDNDGNALQGSEFSLYKVINGKTQTDAAYTAQSGADGKVVFLNVTYGNYVLRETRAPEGYIKSDTEISITKAMLAAELTDAEQHFELNIEQPFENRIIRNTMSLVKCVEGSPEKKVSGAEFTVFDATNDQVVAYMIESEVQGRYELSDRNGAGDTTTDLKNSCNSYYVREQDGELKLAYGRYYIQETTTPQGYMTAYEDDGHTLKKTECSVVTDGLSLLISSTDDGKYYNARALGTIEINKQIEKADQEQTKLTASGQGIIFKVTGKNIWGESIEHQQRLAVNSSEPEVMDGYILTTTNADGNVIITGLEPSDANGYTIEEMETEGVTDPYVIPEKQIVHLTLKENKINNEQLTFINRLKKSDIRGIKFNQDHTALSGAVFGLFDQTVTDYTQQNLFQNMTAESKQDGIFTFTKVPYGTYQIVELTAPNGHIRSDKKAVVTIHEDGSIITKDQALDDLEFMNQIAKNTFTIKKTDVFTQEILPNVKFTLSGKNVYGEDRKEEQFTSEDGMITFENVDAGTYTLSEDKQPGYEEGDSFTVIVTAQDNQTAFTIRNNTTQQQLTAGSDGTYAIMNTPISAANNRITMKKCDQDGSEVSGCTFGLYRTGIDEETPYDTASSDEHGDVTFDDVTFSDYTIRELNAPVGYRNGEDITFTKQDIIEQCKIDSADTSFHYIAGTMTNQLIKGTVSLKKTDAVDHSLLSGAEFGIYADQKCSQKVAILTESQEKGIYLLDNPEDLKVRNQYGSLSATKDADGAWHLSYGTYYVREETAPHNYLRDVNVYQFEIKDDNCVAQISNVDKTTETKEITQTAETTASDAVEFVNDRGIGTFSLTQFLEIKGPHMLESKRADLGSEFIIQGSSYFGVPIQNQETLSGTQIERKDDGIIVTMDEQGQGVLTGLEAGRYEVAQLPMNHTDYVLAERLSFELVVDQSINRIEDRDEEVTNHLTGTNVAGVIKTEEGVVIDQVKIGLFQKDEMEFTSDHVYNNWVTTTDEQGRFDFGNIPFGDYVIAQVKDPNSNKQMIGTLLISVSKDEKLEITNQGITVHYQDEVTGMDTDTQTTNQTEVNQQPMKERTTDQSAATNDQAPVIFLAILLLLSTGIIIFLLLSRKRSHDVVKKWMNRIR